MLSAELLTKWYYLIFLLPLGVSALLLLLSSVRMGHHSGVHGGHSAHGGHGTTGGHRGAVPGHASSGHPGAHALQSHTVSHPGASHGHRGHQSGDSTQHNLASPAGLLLRMMGVGRAPLPMVLEAFFMAWGFCGFVANELFLHTSAPTLLHLAPSFGFGLVGGVIGARLTAEMMARLMPPDESLAVSQQGLFGLTGIVTFPVSARSGRIHIYDEHGTLHDEMCRIAPGHLTIEKGHTALVVDTDPQGLLIVEEIPASSR